MTRGKRYSPLLFIPLFLSGLFLSGLFVAGPARAGTGVLALRSTRIAPYDEALRGFSAVLPPDDEMVISDLPGWEIADELRRRRPRLILAVGLDALTATRGVNGIPVLSLLVPDLARTTGERKDVTGVCLDVAPEEQLAWMRVILPKLGRIGIVHDPARTGHLVALARAAAARLGVALVVEEASSPSDLSARLEKLRGSVDLIWMLPDPTIYTTEAAEFLMLFSLEAGVPVFSFSRKYVELGALASLDLDLTALGWQAGEMARRILRQGTTSDVPPESPRTTVLFVNPTVARNLGIPLDDAVLRSATTIPRERP